MWKRYRRRFQPGLRDCESRCIVCSSKFYWPDLGQYHSQCCTQPIIQHLGPRWLVRRCDQKIIVPRPRSRVLTTEIKINQGEISPPGLGWSAVHRRRRRRAELWRDSTQLRPPLHTGTSIDSLDVFIGQQGQSQFFRVWIANTVSGSFSELLQVQNGLYSELRFFPLVKVRGFQTRDSGQVKIGWDCRRSQNEIIFI